MRVKLTKIIGMHAESLFNMQHIQDTFLLGRKGEDFALKYYSINKNVFQVFHKGILGKASYFLCATMDIKMERLFTILNEF